MIKRAIDEVAGFFASLDRALGIHTAVKLVEEPRGQYPVYFKERGTAAVVPDFFRHSRLSDEVRNTIMTVVYAGVYLTGNREKLSYNPEPMAKAICRRMGMKYMPVAEVEKQLCPVRMALYDEPGYLTAFAVGDELKLGFGASYLVTDIYKREGKVFLVAERSRRDGSKEVQTQEWAELCDLYFSQWSYDSDSVDLRKNLFILSAPSAAGKNTVYNGVKERMPRVCRVITATTRLPRAGERDGEDYFFLTKEEFDRRRRAGEFVEWNLYDEGSYATPLSEIQKYDTDTPLVLILDINGMKSVMQRFPLSTSIFLMPPSLEELENRIRQRGQNTPRQIENRIGMARAEIAQSRHYDHIVVNADAAVAAEQIRDIIVARGPWVE